MGVYPFMFGAYKDFEPVAQSIIKVACPVPSVLLQSIDTLTGGTQRTIRLGRICPVLLSQGRGVEEHRRGGRKGR